MRTEGTASFGDMLDGFAVGTPAGRVSNPEEIAAAIAFLVGPGASNIHGTVLPVDGGLVAA